MSKVVKLSAEDRRWIHVLTDGLVRHPHAPGEAFKVNDAFIAYLEKFLADMRSQGFFPPVCANHVAPAGLMHADMNEAPEDFGRANYVDALVHGRLLDIRRDDEGKTEFLVEWAKYAAKDYDEGRIENFSPTFVWGWTDPTTDITYPVIIKELSFLQHKHLKNVPSASPHYSSVALAETFIRATQVRMQEATMATKDPKTGNPTTEPPKTEEAPTWFKDYVEKQDKRIEGIEAKLGELATPPEPPANEGGEPSGNEGQNDAFEALRKKNEELEKRFAESERRVQLSEAARRVQLESPHISPKHALMLGEVRLDAGEEKYKEMLEAFTSAAKAPEKNHEHIVLLGEGGFGGATQPQKFISMDEAVKLGEEKGLEDGTKEMAEFIEGLGNVRGA